MVTRDKQKIMEGIAAAQARIKEEELKKLDDWKPRTELGRLVKSGKITNIDEVLGSGKRIMEPEIVDILLPDLETDFITIGQAKGKFGGGKRRIFRQTQKKTREGNKPIFSVMAVVGNGGGYFGVGIGKSKETMPARTKAVRNAKLNLMQAARGCGSWECGCGTHHSLPFQVKGKSSSVELKLIPAPKGTGLVVDDEVKKVLKLAGYVDMWCKSSGQTRHKINLITAVVEALKKAGAMRIKEEQESILRYGGISDDGTK